MNDRIQREYRDEVLYVYDRVCSKASKQRQMRHAYSSGRSGQSTREAPSGAGGGQNNSRVYGKAFAQSQWERAAYSQKTFRDSERTENRHENRRAGERVYQYRPGRAQGGEAVKERPLKLVLERIVNFFESVEERGKRDEAIAKKNAIALKKLSEYKHIILTALVLIGITVAFAVLVYKMFFVVDDITINGTSLYTEEEILLSAGFSQGDNLYSFSATEAQDSITFLCPYIKSAEVNRTIPTAVSVTLEDDSAAYYAIVWGDCLKLSAGLRVLEVVDEAEAELEEGLIELILPPVKYAVAGRVIEFADERNDRFIRNVLSETAASSMAENGMIDQVDVSDQYDVTMHACGRYLLRLGSEEDCDLKLRMAYKTMTSDQFDDLLPARIDLSEVGRAIIRPDASLSFE